MWECIIVHVSGQGLIWRNCRESPKFSYIRHIGICKITKNPRFLLIWSKCHSLVVFEVIFWNMGRYCDFQGGGWKTQWIPTYLLTAPISTCIYPPMQPHRTSCKTHTTTYSTHVILEKLTDKQYGVKHLLVNDFLITIVDRLKNWVLLKEILLPL